MQLLRNASSPLARAVDSGLPRSIIRLFAGLTLAASLSGAALVNAGTAAAQSIQPCPSSGSAVAAGLPVCVSQQGTTVIVVIGPIGGAGNPAAATSATASIPPLAGPQIAPISTSSRVSTYAQRQAIRDQYRGQIDELTFNDELGDGVSLYQALADAIAARAAARPASVR